MKRVFQRPYIFLIAGIFLLYVILNVLFSGFYKTLVLITKYITTVNWMSLSISVLLSLTIGFFIAVNSVLLYLRHNARKQCGSAATMTSVGTIGGFITGVCPLCVTGLFPLLFSFFGITFSLGSLPFQGIEVQVVTLALLAISYHLLIKH